MGNGPINQHKELAMGKKVTGMKSGGGMKKGKNDHDADDRKRGGRIKRGKK